VQQAGSAGVALGPQRRERVLDDRGKLWVGPDKIGKLVDDHRDASLTAEGQEGVHRRMPGVEHEGRGRVQVLGQRGAEPVERLPVGRLIGREVEAAGRRAERSEEKGLALPASPGDDPEDRTRSGIGGERAQSSPLTVPVEHLRRPAQEPG
jgi:hypothetical protein